MNYRDLMVAEGAYLVKIESPVIPCSDGAGEVMAVASEVTRVRPGDRVAAAFSPHWLEGQPDQAKIRSSLGGDIDGMLGEAVTLHEDALVRIRASLELDP